MKITIRSPIEIDVDGVFCRDCEHAHVTTIKCTHFKDEYGDYLSLKYIQDPLKIYRCQACLDAGKELDNGTD